MIDVSYIYLFFLVLVRISSFLVTAPVFSSKGVPAQFKLGLSLFLSLIIFSSVSLNVNPVTLDGSYITFIIQEAIIGLIIGWVAQVMFSSIQVAGAFVDMQIGFAMANVIDPQTGASSPLMGNFKYTFAILLFLSIDAHHLLLDGILSSYQTLPLTGDWFQQLNNESVLTFIITIFTQMFVIAFKISAPIVITLFLTDVSLGILARTVPQLNVFVVGLPLKVLVNFFLLLLIAAGLIYIFKELIYEMIITMKQFIDIMGL